MRCLDVSPTESVAISPLLVRGDEKNVRTHLEN
jgi:hypothetical protein